MSPLETTDKREGGVLFGPQNDRGRTCRGADDDQHQNTLPTQLRKKLCKRIMGKVPLWSLSCTKILAEEEGVAGHPVQEKRNHGVDSESTKGGTW